MEQIKKLLELRKNKLEQVKHEKESALKNAPEGSLRINCQNKRPQYFQRSDPKDTIGMYIKEEQLDLARRLAQKDYDQKLLRATEKELRTITRFLQDYPEITAEQVYEDLHPARRVLINPIQLPGEAYIRKWESIQYEGKGFEANTPEFYTEKGERVRSKSELIIADLLHKEGIPYRYEYPIYLRGLGRVYPDFTVLNTRTRKEWIWEHLGRMDDSEYAEKNIRKIAAYEKNEFFPGENLVLTYETRKNPLDQKLVKNMIYRYLK